MSEPTMETLARRLGQALMIACCLVILQTTPTLAMDGSTWRTLPKETRGAYVMGVVDTWGNMESVAEALQIDKMSVIENHYINLLKCLSKRRMRYIQIMAIVEKHMDENPAEWNAEMASSVWAAVNEVCGMQ